MALIIIMLLNITGFWVSSMVCVTSNLIVQLESWPELRICYKISVNWRKLACKMHHFINLYNNFTNSLLMLAPLSLI